jgi:hypothetical protein
MQNGTDEHIRAVRDGVFGAPPEGSIEADHIRIGDGWTVTDSTIREWLDELLEFRSMINASHRGVVAWQMNVEAWGPHWWFISRDQADDWRKHPVAGVRIRPTHAGAPIDLTKSAVAADAVRIGNRPGERAIDWGPSRRSGIEF